MDTCSAVKAFRMSSTRTKWTGEICFRSIGESSSCSRTTIETRSSSRIPASHARFGSLRECDIEISSFVLPRDSNRKPVFRQRMSGTRTRLILIFFQILKPVEPRSSSMGLNPRAFSRLIVAFVPAAPTASFRRKLSSLLKLFATTSPSRFSSSGHCIRAPLPDTQRSKPPAHRPKGIASGISEKSALVGRRYRFGRPLISASAADR